MSAIAAVGVEGWQHRHVLVKIRKYCEGSLIPTFIWKTSDVLTGGAMTSKQLLSTHAACAAAWTMLLLPAAAQQDGGAAGSRYDAPQALWSTPGDGRLVMLVRNAVDQDPTADPAFKYPVPFRVRVCVTNFSGTANAMNLFVWTTDGPGPNGAASLAQPQVLHPGLGDCVEVDRPATIIAQDSTISGAASGYYQLLETIALPAKSKVARSAPVPIKISDPSKPTPVKCAPLQSDPQKPSPNYTQFCELQLENIPTNQVGLRICTDEKFVTYKDGTTLDYPAGYLELTTTDLRQTAKNSDYNPYWNPVTPVSCRDVIWPTGVDKPSSRSLFFMVGPTQPVPPWIPANVDSVTIVMQTISLGQ